MFEILIEVVGFARSIATICFQLVVNDNWNLQLYGLGWKSWNLSTFITYIMASI